MDEMDKLNADDLQQKVMETRRYNESVARENARIRQVRSMLAVFVDVCGFGFFQCEKKRIYDLM